MTLRSVLLTCVAGSFLACPPVVAPKCDAPDAGETKYEARLRFVNLGREAVTVTLEGEDAGAPVLPMQSKNYVGHVTLIKQRVEVAARNFLPDGGLEDVVLPFEFDTTTGEVQTFVLRDLSPARLSMNVTVGKQTQGATFGEKVQAGLANVELEGGVDTGGDCAADFSGTAGVAAKVSLRDDVTTDCDSTMDHYFTRPPEVDDDASPYFVRVDGEPRVAWVEGAKVQSGVHAAGGALAQGASLLGGALPGGAVISAAVSQVYVLNTVGSQQPASLAIEDGVVVDNVVAGALVRVKPTALAAAARRGKLKGKISTPRDTGMRVTITVGGSTQTTSLGATDQDTLLTVSENTDNSASVLKAERKGWDGTVKGGSRVFVAANTTSLETRGCVAVFPADDTCVMGATAVSTLAGAAGGGASTAAYAATGRLLKPPGKKLGVEPTRFGVEELGVVAQRFIWLDPAGLTPVQGKSPSGFVIITPGTALDAAAVDQRALWFVDTSATPWSLSAPALSVIR